MGGRRSACVLGAFGAAALHAGAARAQWAGAVEGAYNKNTITLNDGSFLPLQIDQNGNLKVDCIAGCSGAATQTVNQGTAAAIANAWPVTIALGGAALGTSNALPTTDTQDGTAISGATMPSGGAGLLGWLSAIDKGVTGTLSTTDTQDGSAITAASMPSGGAGLLGWLSAIQKSVSGNVATTDSADGAPAASPSVANQGSGLLGWLGTIAAELAPLAAGPLPTVPGGITGAPTVSSGSLSASGNVLSAANGKRLHMKVWNFAGAGGASLYCTDDGSTPTATNASFIVYAQGGYERDAPAWVPSAAIACLPGSGSVSFRAESYP